MTEKKPTAFDGDICAEIKLLTTEEGGRRGPITGRKYSCPLVIDGRGYDCRILIGNRTLTLGQSHYMCIKFLDRDFSMPLFTVGKVFSLWEGREIGSGIVIERSSS